MFLGDPNIYPMGVLDPLNLTGEGGYSAQANQQAAQLLASAGPMPSAPSFTSIYNPSMADTVQAPTSGLNAFQAQALSTGPSPWAQQATQQQEALAKNAQSAGAHSVAGQGATARSQLAQSGGLTGGAAERVATEGQKNYLNMSQGINQQKSTNEMQIGMNDQQNRLQELSQLPGMQLNNAQFQSGVSQFNTGAQMANNQALNAFNLGQYQTQMANYGAAQTAAAQAQAGKHKTL